MGLFNKSYTNYCCTIITLPSLYWQSTLLQAAARSTPARVRVNPDVQRATNIVICIITAATILLIINDDDNKRKFQTHN